MSSTESSTSSIPLHLLSFIKNPLKVSLPAAPNELPSLASTHHPAQLTIAVTYEGIRYEHQIQQTPIFIHGLAEKIWDVVLKHSESSTQHPVARLKKASKDAKKSSRISLNIKSSRVVSPRASPPAPTFHKPESPDPAVHWAAELKKERSPGGGAISPRSPEEVLVPNAFHLTFAQLVQQQAKISARYAHSAPVFVATTVFELLKRGVAVPNLFSLENSSPALVDSLVQQVDSGRAVNFAIIDPRCIAQLLLKYLSLCRFFENPIEEQYFIAAAEMSPEDQQQHNTLLRLLRSITPSQKDFLALLLTLLHQIHLNTGSLSPSVSAIAHILFSRSDPDAASRALDVLYSQFSALFLSTDLLADRRAPYLTPVLHHISHHVAQHYLANILTDPDIVFLRALAAIIDTRQAAHFAEDIMALTFTYDQLHPQQQQQQQIQQTQQIQQQQQQQPLNCGGGALSLHVLRRMMFDEIDRTHSSANLFRTDSMFTHSFAVWLKSEGQAYLQQLLEPVFSYLQLSAAISAPSAPEAGSAPNEEVVLEGSRILIDRITGSFERFPKKLLDLLNALHGRVSQKWPDPEVALRAIGGLVILRWISPAMIRLARDPSSSLGTDSAASKGDFHQIVLSITKVVQLLANKKSKGASQGSIQFMNAFIASHQATLPKFFAQLAHPDAIFPPRVIDADALENLRAVHGRLIFRTFLETITLLPKLEEYLREQQQQQHTQGQHSEQDHPTTEAESTFDPEFLAQLTLHVSSLTELTTVPLSLHPALPASPTERLIPSILSEVKAPTLISKLGFEDLVSHVNVLGNQANAFAVFFASGQFSIWLILPDGLHESRPIMTSCLDISSSALSGINIFAEEKQKFWLAGSEGLKLITLSNVSCLISPELMLHSDGSSLPIRTVMVDQEPLIACCYSSLGVIASSITAIKRMCKNGTKIRRQQPTFDRSLQCLFCLEESQPSTIPISLVLAGSDAGELCIYDTVSLKLLTHVSCGRASPIGVILSIRVSHAALTLSENRQATRYIYRLITATLDKGIIVWMLSITAAEEGITDISLNLLTSKEIGSAAPVTALLQVSDHMLWVASGTDIYILDIDTLSLLSFFSTAHRSAISHLVCLWYFPQSRWVIISSDPTCICMWLPSVVLPAPHVTTNFPPTPDQVEIRLMPRSGSRRGFTRTLQPKDVAITGGRSAAAASPSPPPTSLSSSSSSLSHSHVASAIKPRKHRIHSSKNNSLPSPRQRSSRRTTEISEVPHITNDPFPGIVLRESSSRHPADEVPSKHNDPFPGIALRESPSPQITRRGSDIVEPNPKDPFPGIVLRESTSNNQPFPGINLKQ